MPQHEIPDLPLLERDEDGPVFREPWEAQAFGMVMELVAQGRFSWAEWSDQLGAEIKAAQATGDPDLGNTYYQHWLRALEVLVVRKGLTSEIELAVRKQDWERAAAATPHGEPILLPRDKTSPLG